MTDPIDHRWPEDGPVAPDDGQPPAGEPAATRPDEQAAGEQAAGEQVVREQPTGPTGHPVVDAAVARLAEQADLPPGEQVAGYETAQRELHQTLASIDQT